MYLNELKSLILSLKSDKGIWRIKCGGVNIVEELNL